MRCHPRLWLVAVSAAFGPASAAKADVFIRAPFVTVHVGRPGVYVGVRDSAASEPEA